MTVGRLPAMRVRSLCALILSICAIMVLRASLDTVFAVPRSSARWEQGSSSLVDAGPRKTGRLSRMPQEAAYSVGGAKSQSTLTAVNAGISVFILCALDAFTKSRGLPLWAPPLAAVSLIFAADATAASSEGKILSNQAMFDKALATGTAVAGAAILTVLVTKVLGATPLGRAVAVCLSALWMYAFPVSSFFPPTGAFCVLFVDQTMVKGPLSMLMYKYALFPCAAGTVFLLVCTRVVASLLAQPLRMVNSGK
eukprot:TRINITY_DN10243_c0_g1_i1.p1 TRINITY_DN10243_c0_g1~~TRINITY_DN10243_c0_g1_i1.p1  ORF type:complete len:253 (-),score=43.00 TRINITY_DN10243_c0_g1_i1:44-802(-)